METSTASHHPHHDHDSSDDADAPPLGDPRRSSSSSDHSLVPLSLLWLALCTGLVTKHPPLLLVFLAFLACFAVAGVLWLIKIIIIQRPHRHCRHRTSCWKNPNIIMDNNNKSFRIIRTQVGLAVCTVSLWMLQQQQPQDASSSSSSSSWILSATSGGSSSSNNNSFWSNYQQLHGNLSLLFMILCLLAGYLAFDHWFTALWCCPKQQQHPKPLLTAMEDALTLSFLLIVLVVMLMQQQHQQQQQQQQQNHNDSNNNNDNSSLSSKYHQIYLSTWLVYKLVRLALQLESSSSSSSSFSSSSPVTTAATTTTTSSLSPPPSSLSSLETPAAITTTTRITPTKTNKLSDQVISKAAATLASTAATATTTSVSTLKESTSSSTTPLKNHAAAAAAAAAAADDDSCLWHIHGISYDLRDYIAQHPGGKEAILLGQGRRDCTALFESYHPFTTNHKRVLQKYRQQEHHLPGKGNSNSNNNNSFLAEKTQQQRHKKSDSDIHNQDNDKFYALLCERVATTLRQDHNMDPVQDRAATYTRWLYYCTILMAVVWSAVAHATGSIIGSFVLAVTGWLLGALGHDAGHFAVSRFAVVNDVCVWGMSLLCNPMIWQHQHTFAHHSHTNTFEHDPDLHHFHTLLRVHRKFTYQPIFQYQKSQWFVAFAYAFVCFGTCFWIPMGMIRDGTLYGIVEWSERRRRPVRAAALWIHLVLYTGFIMLWPFYVHAHWYTALTAVVLHLSTSGLIFAVFSQINHLNEASLDVSPQERHVNNSFLRDSWAVAQIETSNNFCPNSAIWHVLSNGLHLQIEHHLFPGLNHCHLPKIHAVVKRACEEHGVVYKSYNSWSEIMGATLVWLDKLANEP